NLANAQGAYFGGLALDAGLGWTSPTLVGAGLAASGAVVALLAWAADRHRPADGSPAVPAPAGEAREAAAV
ncbi:MFS transporter, partial [Kitasatospora sp. NPDC093558]